MTYIVHEIFLTVQGEGANMGRVAVFCRFAGCNLWSGREEDRAAAICKFCDTQFVGGTRYPIATLADAIADLWPGNGDPLVVFTGGEPLLQLDAVLIHAMHRRGFDVAVETNGTKSHPDGIDWLCVSPKAGAPLALAEADELKLVYPQPGAMPDDFGRFRARHRWLSPMDGPDYADNCAAAMAYCLAHPEWRMNIQAHKTWGVR